MKEYLELNAEHFDYLKKNYELTEDMSAEEICKRIIDIVMDNDAKLKKLEERFDKLAKNFERAEGVLRGFFANYQYCIKKNINPAQKGNSGL